MIITVDYIRTFRPIAGNIDDKKVEIYIHEAEQLDILPVIGAELYKKLSEQGTVAAQSEGKTASSEQDGSSRTGDGPKLTAEEAILLNGGYYTDNHQQEQRFEGLKTALAYLAYSRFVRNHSTNITPYGVVYKTGEDSSPTDARTISAVSQDALRIGQEYLAKTMTYWNTVRDKSCSSTQKSVYRPRLIPIG